MKTSKSNFIETLTSNGWNLTPSKETLSITNDRLQKAPAEFKQFIAQFDALSNEDETAWFLSLKDYETEADEDAFAWNEFEKECIESAEDDEELAEATAFWEQVLPIAMSVNGEHAYLGLIIAGDNKGKIVYGCEPMYEDTEIVCDSFAELLALFAKHVAGNGDEDSVLNDFV